MAKCSGGFIENRGNHADAEAGTRDQNRGRLISRLRPRKYPGSHGMLMRSTPTILRKPQGLPFEGEGEGGRKRPRRPTSGPPRVPRTYRCAITTVPLLPFPRLSATTGCAALLLEDASLLQTFAPSSAYPFRVSSDLPRASSKQQKMDSKSLAD